MSLIYPCEDIGMFVAVKSMYMGIVRLVLLCTAVLSQNCRNAPPIVITIVSPAQTPRGFLTENSFIDVYICKFIKRPSDNLCDLKTI